MQYHLLLMNSCSIKTYNFFQGEITLKRILSLLLFLLLSMNLTACDEAEIEKVDKEENNIIAEENHMNSSTDSEENNEVNEENEANEEEDENLIVGDTVNFDGLEITLNEVRNEPGGEFDEPNEDLFIVANLTIENTTDEEQAISSIMNIELKDEEGYSYNTTFLTEGTKGQLDGSIEPGGKMRGEIPFDVSESDTYELHFSDPFKSGKAIWHFTFEELE